MIQLLYAKDIQPCAICHRKADVVDIGGGESKGVPEVVEDKLVHDQMSERNNHQEPKSAKNNWTVDDILHSVDKLEQAYHEADHCRSHGASQVDLSNSKVAVHRVVEGRESTTSDQQRNPRKVKTKQKAVGF